MEKYFHFDRFKTLEEIEGQDLGESNFNSYLVTTCQELRKKPISSFTVEDLRIMIGQNIGLNYLIPLALEILEDNLFSQGDLYSGDLLNQVLKVSKDFWESNPKYKNDLIDILEKNIKDLASKLHSFR
ncbi:contact-dependent growth inhibition system immunity protein [Herbivorax sp. ANBcel31]|uniref:contact-dependent growth inhibition system immunity protein n=1 Tax=Herbivorax sp. ANBcel31 TaxID=3069754 RepID=UPI0027B8498C|nr:contact-dependent growth inhibition system immunity protein [Herbivorax sp. ANBcel31]MDQ2088017.1 contact-dependent growth inhibition system immunity protein [Herbivorax sp. ANBcel31]